MSDIAIVILVLAIAGVLMLAGTVGGWGRTMRLNTTKPQTPPADDDTELPN